MSEENQTPEPVKTDPSPAKDNSAELQKQLAEIKQAQEALSAKADKTEKENAELKRLNEERDKKLRQILLGEEDKKELHPIVSKLLKQPESWAKDLVDYIKEDIKEEENLSRSQINAVKEAAREVLKDRPDIHGDADNREMVSTYYQALRSENPEMTEKEAFEKAVVKFDKMAEKYGFKNRLEEMKKNVGTPTSGGTVAKAEKSEREIYQEAQAAERERKLKARGRGVAA